MAVVDKLLNQCVESEPGIMSFIVDVGITIAALMGLLSLCLYIYVDMIKPLIDKNKRGF